MTQVARAFGPSFDHVWRQPYHMTLLAFCGLVERERIDGLVAHARDVATAERVNLAMAAPKELGKERAAVRRALRMPARTSPTAKSAAELVAQFAHLRPAD